MNIKSFSSFEEMLASMAQDRAVADAQVDPVQSGLKIGDFFIRETHGLVIYGEVLNPIDGEDEEEREFQRRTRNQPHMKHYRFTKCYSPVVPDGEYGDIHVSTVSLVLSREMFDRCRAAGWPQDPKDLWTLLDIQPEGVA